VRSLVLRWFLVGGVAATSTGIAAQAAQGQNTQGQNTQGQDTLESSDPVQQAERAFTEGRSFIGRHPEAARAAFVKATQAAPSWPPPWYALAMLERRQGRHGEAIVAYRRYLALMPADPEPLFGLGLSLQATGQIADARSTFERFLREAKDPALAPYVDRARAALANLPADPRTESGLPKAPPASVAANVGSCEASLQAGNYDEAQVCLARLTSLAPTDAAALYDLAFVERQLRHDAAAARAFRAYITLTPNDPDPYYGLAAALAAAGDRTGAADALRSYLQFENRPSEARWVARARRRLQALEGNPHPNVSGGAPGGAVP